MISEILDNIKKIPPYKSISFICINQITYDKICEECEKIDFSNVLDINR